MPDIQNELSWSVSRGRMLGKCHRMYFFHYYLSWGGWKRDAPALNRKAYILKQIRTIPMYVGSVCHALIADLLSKVRVGESPTVDFKQIGRSMDKVFKESSSRRWEKYAKAGHFLEDHYYGGITPGDRKDAKQKVIDSIRVFMESPIYSVLSDQSKPKEWLVIDDPDSVPSFRIADIKVFAALDLAVKMGGKYHVFDWKTGSMDEAEREQLSCYALFAAATWGCQAQELALHAVDLYPSFLRRSYSSSDVGLSNARSAIIQNYRLMERLHAVSHFHEPFLKTNDPSICKWCNFQEICE